MSTEDCEGHSGMHYSGATLANTNLVSRTAESVDQSSENSSTRNILSLPNSRKVHPLMNKLHLIACWLSGDPTKSETFRVKLPISYSHHGIEELKKQYIGGFRQL